MTQAECKVETIKHIERVRYYLRIMTDKLTNRGVTHDKTKLESPEVELFTEFTPRLAELKYGSEEYKESLAGLKPALEHHYANSRHHPEHFNKGINDMNLIDIMEMLCDWKAAGNGYSGTIQTVGNCFQLFVDCHSDRICCVCFGCSHEVFQGQRQDKNHQTR